MTLVAREFKIIYGTITLGAGTDYIIDGSSPLKIDKNYASASVEATIIVTGTSEATFNTNCAAIEAAFRVPRQTLQVILGSTTMWNYSASANTGFNAEPRISKPGSKHDTGRSRRYVIGVSVTLPADLSGQNGRLNSSLNLTETDSRRKRFILSGTYTALGSNSARAQYEASIEAYVTTIITAFGGTWEGPFDMKAESDDANKILNFSRTYEELIYNQSTGVLDDTQIRRQKLTIDKTLEAPGDGDARTVRLATVVVRYEASIDATNTTALETVYSSKIRPFLLDAVRVVTGAVGQALTNEKVNYDRAENVIAVTLVVVAAGSSGILSSNLMVEDNTDAGIVLLPVWSGDRLAKHKFQGPANIVRTVTVVTRELEGQTALGGSAGGSSGSTSLGDSFGIFGANKPISFDFGGDSVGGSFFGIGGGGGGGGGTVGTGAAKISPLGNGIKQPPTDSPDGGTLASAVLSVVEKEAPQILGRPGDPQIRVVDRTTVTVTAFYVVPPNSNSGTGYSVR